MCVRIIICAVYGTMSIMVHVLRLHACDVGVNISFSDLSFYTDMLIELCCSLLRCSAFV